MRADRRQSRSWLLPEGLFLTQVSVLMVLISSTQCSSSRSNVKLQLLHQVCGSLPCSKFLVVVKKKKRLPSKLFSFTKLLLLPHLKKYKNGNAYCSSETTPGLAFCYVTLTFRRAIQGFLSICFPINATVMLLSPGVSPSRSFPLMWFSKGQTKATNSFEDGLKCKKCWL